MNSHPSSANHSLTSSDHWVIGLALIGLISMIILLLNERLFFKIGFQSLGQHQRIASITHSIKDVRRRVEEDVIWLPLFNDDAVYESDAIYTGQDSETEI